MSDISIGNISIGRKHRPFVIAEMSGNHNKSLDRALGIVEAAAKSGAHALKLQTYTADTMTLDVSGGEFFIDDVNNIWKGQHLYDLYKQAYTPWEWHTPIMQRANELGMICFSSPFDESAVDFLEEINVPAYKIASFELTDIPLIKKVALTGKPIILSTGMATLSDIKLAVNTIEKTSTSPICLLHCVSGYPTPIDEVNLKGIESLKENFDMPIGLSDHTLTTLTSVCATSMGANVIEKHLTLDRKSGGPDCEFSLEPEEFTRLCQDVRTAFTCLGSSERKTKDSEKNNTQFRRSIYVVKDIKKDQVITKDIIRIIRPSHGLEPKYYEDVLGRRANQDITAGTPLSYNLITEDLGIV